MAQWMDPTDKQRAAWREWTDSRPPVVRAIAERLDPWTLYLLRPTGQRVTLLSIFENGTVRVMVSADFNLTDFERSVFGIDPADLEPCDLPSEDEPLGALMSQQEVNEKIYTLRRASNSENPQPGEGSDDE